MMLSTQLIAWLQSKNWKSERGAGLAEYALILALVAVAVAAGVTGLAGAITTALGNTVTAIN